MNTIDLTPEFFGMYFSYDWEGRYPIQGSVRPDISKVYLQQGPVEGTDRLYRVAMHKGIWFGEYLYRHFTPLVFVSNAIIVGALQDEYSAVTFSADGIDCIAYYSETVAQEALLQWMRTKSKAPVLPSLLYRANVGEYTALPGRRFHNCFFEFHDAIAVAGVNWSALRGTAIAPMHPYKEESTLLLRFKIDATATDKQIIQSDWLELIYEHESESLTLVLKPVIGEPKRVALRGRAPFGQYCDVAIAVGEHSYAIVNGMVTTFTKPSNMKRQQYVASGDTPYMYQMVDRPRVPSLYSDNDHFFEPDYLSFDVPGRSTPRPYNKEYVAKISAVNRAVLDIEELRFADLEADAQCGLIIEQDGVFYDSKAKGVCRSHRLSDWSCSDIGWCFKSRAAWSSAPTGTRVVYIGPREEDLHLGVTMLPILQWRIYEIDMSDINNPRLAKRYHV